MHVDESWIILPRGGTTAEAAFNHHLAVVGTAHKMTPHDMPQLSGVAEHLNHVLLKRICALAHQTGLPKLLWGEVLRHATYLKNRTATRPLDEALYGWPPDLSALRP